MKELKGTSRWMLMNEITVIGAGLAGCESAWQIAKRGIKVQLLDMKPKKFSPAHKSPYLCELVCSNSFKSNNLDSASGILKEELRKMDSLVLSCADKCKVPAGGALAVDREEFSKLVTSKIKNHPNISFIESEVKEIDEEKVNIIASGPLTSDSLADYISDICGGLLNFFDAAAPIITFESINTEHAFYASRYGKGEDNAYLNCPMNKKEYLDFYDCLVSAERAPVKDFDKLNPKVYEGCMPIEVLASRGIDSLRFGPMKPVGLKDPITGMRPYAVIQLRKENLSGSLYNMVGFQTNLKFKEQEKVFSMVPALRNVEIIRYGVMHRNTFINSPNLLNPDYSLKRKNNIFFAGQITGTEGYMESVSSGLIAGINAYRRIKGLDPIIFPKETMIGALADYISNSETIDFQPMGANFGIIPLLSENIRNKKLKRLKISQRSIKIIEEMINHENNG